MRYVDDELPWFWRIPVRAGVILSPQLRRRICAWRRMSSDVTALLNDSKRTVAGVPERARSRAPGKDS